MITIHVTLNDLAGLRFAYRPLLEIPLSYRVLINPDMQGRYTSWVEEARNALHDLDLPYLHALVPPHRYIPDFLTPTPTTSRRDIHADIEEMLATPDDLIRQNVQELINELGETEMRRFFVAHPREAITCLADDLRLYWQRVLAHHWQRMQSILETDILYRARTLALDGPGPMFDSLHPTVKYQDGQIRLAPTCFHLGHDREIQLRGDGLQLTPVIFGGCGRMYQMSPEWQPMLAYVTRGTGMWHEKPPVPNRSLELALGAGRARVLQSLSTPLNTGELAFKLHLTAGTISQHLDRLAKAGLVESRRSGKRVYYHLTERGESLLALFDRMD